MAKLLKLRRGTTSQHNTFTGAEGEVTIDTTKDTAVVHDGSTAGGRPLAREDMSNVSSSSIAGRLGADSIATTKIAAGALPSDVTIDGTNITAGSIHNSDVNSSAAIAGTKISPAFGSQNLSTSGTAATGALTVTGNIAVSGTVDGRDVASDGSKLDGIESGATADQTAAEIRALVESASDSNVFTNADHSKLNGIESGATADQTAAEILTAIKTVDGSGSGLDADTLDGAQPSDTASNSTIVKRNSSGYVFANYFNTTANDVTSGVTSIMVETSNDNYIRHGKAGAVRSFLNVEDGATADQSASEILTAIKTVDGAGSGLDADTLDGVNSTSFLRSDAADSASQDITFNGGGGAVTIGGNSDIRLNAGNWTGEASAKIQHHSNHLYVQYPDAGTFRVRDSAGNDNFTVDSSGNATAVGNVTAYSDARLKTDISTINDALGIVGKLRGVSYKWLRDGTEGIGVIAQEVEAVIPSVVVTNEVPGLDGMEEVKSVDYGKIVGVLINAINELKAEVDELKGGK